jgi:hypothetical protein
MILRFTLAAVLILNFIIADAAVAYTVAVTNTTGYSTSVTLWVKDAITEPEQLDRVTLSAGQTYTFTTLYPKCPFRLLAEVDISVPNEIPTVQQLMMGCAGQQNPPEICCENINFRIVKDSNRRTCHLEISR